MAKTHRLTALRGRPNRVLPIGTIPDGKHKGQPFWRHVRTGATLLIDAVDVPALEAFLQVWGILADYKLVRLPGRRRPRRGPKGRRTLPGTRQRARAAEAAAGAPAATPPSTRPPVTGGPAPAAAADRTTPRPRPPVDPSSKGQ